MAFDSSQQRFNIVASPLIPQDCLMFLRDEQVTSEPESSRNLHQYHMLWFCISGRGCLLIDNVPYVLAAGEAVLLTPGQPHRRRRSWILCWIDRFCLSLPTRIASRCLRVW